jgi:hypothetical protein
VECDRAELLLNARLDGELPAGSDDAAALDGHLATCAGCRAVAEALSADDAELAAAFAPRRESAASLVAARAIDELRPPRRGTPVWRPWLKLGLAAAAGFAAAVLLIGPWNRDGGPARPVIGASQPADPAMATLALATGAVELQSGGAWRPMPTGGTVRPGEVVRTGDKVRCEFVTPDGSLVRVNERTELTFRRPRLFELAAGQVWSTVAKAAEPFRVKVPDAEVTALGTQFDVACAGPGVVTLTVVEGSTRVSDRSGEKVVHSGERLTINAGVSEAPRPADNLMVATRWVNEILVMKGRDNAELSKRIDALFAQIGRQKMSFLYEDEIRALGDHCVVPLTRFLCDDAAGKRQDDDNQRRNAARILADVAQPWSAGELIKLLPDRDGEVRYHAARALERVANANVGRTPEQWRDEPAERGAEALRQWQQWWAENRERFPALPPS